MILFPNKVFAIFLEKQLRHAFSCLSSWLGGFRNHGDTNLRLVGTGGAVLVVEPWNSYAPMS
jgi:hypothetical protein